MFVILGGGSGSELGVVQGGLAPGYIGLWQAGGGRERVVVVLAQSRFILTYHSLTPLDTACKETARSRLISLFSCRGPVSQHFCSLTHWTMQLYFKCSAN